MTVKDRSLRAAVWGRGKTLASLRRRRSSRCGTRVVATVKNQHPWSWGGGGVALAKYEILVMIHPTAERLRRLLSPLKTCVKLRAFERSLCVRARRFYGDRCGGRHPCSDRRCKEALSGGYTCLPSLSRSCSSVMSRLSVPRHRSLPVGGSKYLGKLCPGFRPKGDLESPTVKAGEKGLL